MFGRLLLSAFFGCAVALTASPQTPDPAPSQTPPAASDSSGLAPAATRKVWTNDDVKGGKGGVSVVGNKGNQYHMSPAAPADAATIARIKQSLEKLQTQLDDLNNKLKSYKQFQEGEPVSKGERDMSKGYSRTPVDQQMAQLLDKKKKLETEIGDLLDEARKKGVDPGQLR
jgi:hypothetical protein